MFLPIEPAGRTFSTADGSLKAAGNTSSSGTDAIGAYREQRTTWLAGGGVKSGFSYGATDEFGHKAVEGKVHMHDLHATLLHLLGLDHERLTYRYAGRDFRLTDVHGNVVKEILA